MFKSTWTKIKPTIQSWSTARTKFSPQTVKELLFTNIVLWTCELFISKSCSTWKGRFEKSSQSLGTILSPWCCTFPKENVSHGFFLFLPSFFFSSLLPSLSLFLPFFIVLLPSFLFHTKEIQNVLLEEWLHRFKWLNFYAFLSLKKKAFLGEKS